MLFPCDLTNLDEMNKKINNVRQAQRFWASSSVPNRLEILRQFRQAMLNHMETWPADEILENFHFTVSQGLPVLDACKFLEENALEILRPEFVKKGFSFWMRKLDVTVHREPFGVVLIIAPRNYPFMLPAIQALQALAAGNAVVIKPGKDGTKAATSLRALLLAAGLPENLLVILDESTESAEAAIDSGVDKILFTGSYETGVAVYAAAARKMIPVTMELSGCDAVFVFPGADLSLAARAILFGMTLNNSATCISPKRVFAHQQVYAQLLEQLKEQHAKIHPVEMDQNLMIRAQHLINEAVHQGAKIVCGEELQPVSSMKPVILTHLNTDLKIMKEDLFAPVITVVPVKDEYQANAFNQQCPYALGATIFASAEFAERFALEIPAGIVVINDMIVPTADPRVPFGGRNKSGFGVTRGKEGLLQLTQTKAIVHQKAKWLPHLAPQSAREKQIFTRLIGLFHRNAWGKKLGLLMKLLRENANRPPFSKEDNGKRQGLKQISE